MIPMFPRRGAIIGGLMTVLSGLGGTAAAAEQAPPGQLAHYGFDDPKGCFLPLQPMGKGIECVRGIEGHGIRFRGESHLATSGLPFEQESLSISLWLYMDKTDKDEMKLVMRDTEGLLPRIFQLQVYNPVHGYGDSRIRFFGETDPGGGWEIAAFTESTSILPGRWYHVVVTLKGEDRTGPGQVRIWLNGRQEQLLANNRVFATKRSLAKAMAESKAGSQTTYQLNFSGRLLSNPKVPLTIGTGEESRYVFDGVIDEVRLFDYPLDREEIRNLYRSAR